MASLQQLNKKRNNMLLNEFSSEEISKFYRVLNAKYIETIGTVANNFHYDKEKQENLKKEIEELNLTLKEKYYINVVDSNTKFNALLEEYFKLQEAYINKEILYMNILIVEKQISIIKSTGVLKRNFLELYYNYIKGNLTEELEDLLNFNIESATTDVDENITFFNNLKIPSLNYFKGYEEYTEEVEGIFNKLLAEVNETISDYAKLIANPFHDGINLEFDFISEIYSNEHEIQKKQKEILNNVPEYDFINFKLIRPEGAVEDG